VPPSDHFINFLRLWGFDAFDTFTIGNIAKASFPQNAICRLNQICNAYAMAYKSILKLNYICIQWHICNIYFINVIYFIYYDLH